MNTPNITNIMWQPLEIVKQNKVNIMKISIL